MLKSNNIIILLILVLLIGLSGCNSEKTELNTAPIVKQNKTDFVQTETVPQDETGSVENGTVPEEGRAPKPVMIETKPNNWYIKLVAADPSRNIKSISAKFGQVDENDAVEKHTLEATPAMGTNYIDIVFRDPSGVDSGDYKVNFHTYEEDMDDNWQFTVRTDDVNADIFLTWRGLYVLTPYTDDQSRQRYRDARSVSNPLFKTMKLVDTETGKEIAAVVGNKVQIYSFNMSGQKERTFTWTMQTDEISETLREESKMLTLEATSIKENAATAP